MKRFVSVFLTLMLLVFAAAGCDGGVVDVDDTTPKVISPEPSAEPSDEPSTDVTTEPSEDVGDPDNENEENEEDEEMQYPQVTITMEDGGVMVAELYPEKAPNTVNNFISLVKSGFYDGLIFHRVIEGFMLQGGDPDGVGTGGPGYSIKGEFASNGFEQNDLLHTPGVLSMARSMNPDSAGSQFFIMTSTSPHLDGDYAAFGKVIEGMDVAYKIETVQTDANDKPKTEQKIKSITVDTFGVEYPEPEVIK